MTVFAQKWSAAWCLAALCLLGSGHPADAQAKRDPQDDTAQTSAPTASQDSASPGVNSIISDDEFENRIPSIPQDYDKELDAPLKSIADFERGLDKSEIETAQEPSGTDALSASAIGSDEPDEEMAKAPIQDAELVRPLTAIPEFNATPVTAANIVDGDDTIEVEYVVQIEGFESADALATTSVQSQFEDLSTLGENGSVENIAQLSARLDEDKALILRLLAAKGWHDARVTTRIQRGEPEARNPNIAIITVDPRERFTFADITIDAPATDPKGLIRENLNLEVGEPIVAERVLTAEAQVSLALPQAGYPFALIGDREIVLDRATGNGDYTLPVQLGPKARFGSIRATGDLTFDPEHIQVLARFERGELYDSTKVDDLREAMIATGLFSRVSIQPQTTGQSAGDDSEYAELVVEQNAGPPRSIAASAGFGTGQGFSLEGSWTHRNLFPPEGALILRGIAGTREQGAGVVYRQANAGKRDRTVQITADARRSNFEAFEAFTGRLAALVSYDSTNLWQKPLTYAFGVQFLATNEQDFNFDRNALDRRTFYVGGLTGQLGIDRTDDLLDATRGFRITALVEPEGVLENGFTPYVRTQIDGSAYASPSDAITVAGRIRLGSIQGIENFDLAPSRRLYAGGGGSVRGFGFQELGPRVAVPNSSFDPNDPDDDAEPFNLRPTGGRGLAEAAAEIRYRFGNFGIVGFVDAGQVYQSTLPQFTDIRFGAGIGARYYTNFGPLRLDIARPIDRREGESAITIYVSIGQAF